MPKSVFYTVLILALVVAAAYTWYGVPWVAVVNIAIVAISICVEARGEHWILRWRLWWREQALRDLDWALDDVDDAMLVERWVHGAGTSTFVAHAARLSALHAKRRGLCGEIFGLRLALGLPTLAGLEHVSAWADTQPLTKETLVEQADAEIKRIRAL